MVCESVIRLANKTSVSTEINCLRILHAITLVPVCESRVDSGQRVFSAFAVERASKQIAQWIGGSGEEDIAPLERWDAEGRRKWIGIVNREADKRKQTLKKLKKEQQKELIREMREQMRKRMDRPREKEISRLMGKREEGTQSKSAGTS